MNAIVTVIGQDRVGIVADVSCLLREWNVNILDISQTVMREFFTMTMLVDVSDSSLPMAQLAAQAAKSGEEIGLQIRIQREDIFNAMHRI